MPEGRVIGGIHASTMAQDTVADRDVLWAFAEGYGVPRESSRVKGSASRGETFLKMGKAKFIATREIVIEFVF